MPETGNHGLASEALLEYKTALRHFIGQQLKSHAGGQGDWFDVYVIQCLSGIQQDALRRRLKDWEENRESLRRPSDVEGPEQFLEETHFPQIVQKHWNEVFHHSLKDRSAVLNDLRAVRNFRNDGVAHAQEQLADDELIALLEACGRLLEFVNREAARKVQSLIDRATSPGNEEAEAAQLEGTKEEPTPASDEEDFRAEADPTIAEGLVAEASRLDELASEYLKADEAAVALNNLQANIEETMSDLGLEFFGNIEDEMGDAWYQVRRLQLEDIGAELIAETMRESRGWEETGVQMRFDAVGSEHWVRVNVEIDIRDVEEYHELHFPFRLRPPWARTPP